MRTYSTLFLVAAIGLTTIGSASAALTTINFEGLPDGTALGNQYAGQGITFSGGIAVLSAAFGGSILNESEFPPRSGAAVFLNDANTTTISFSSPITSFQGFFTYGGPLTLNFYDAGNNPLGTIQSAFSGNLAISGPGSPANEELAIALLNNATRLDILAPNADFALDDLTVNTAGAVSAVPEPLYSIAVASVASALAALRLLRRTR